MKYFLLRICILMLKIFYFFFKMLPTKNKIVMISRQSNSINKDFSLISSHLKKKYEVIILCKMLKGGSKAKFIDSIKYAFHMIKQLYHIATSKVCILDSYCIAISLLKHKKSLTVIQIWHSIGTMKKFGYTVLGKEEGSNIQLAKIMKMHNNYDIVFCSSKAYKEHLQNAFNIEMSKIKIFTLPRVDLLNDKEYKRITKLKIYKKYPQIKDKKNVVYAPTFRKNEKEFYKKLNDLINCFDFSRYNLFIKLHPLSKIKINNTKVIVDNDFSTFDMLFIADKLISDYSCIIYEAGIRNIPLYFYFFDLHDYDVKRGLALDYKELPGFIEKNAKALVEKLELDFNMKYQKEFIKKYVENTKNCTIKMVHEIEKYMK